MTFPTLISSASDGIWMRSMQENHVVRSLLILMTCIISHIYRLIFEPMKVACAIFWSFAFVPVVSIFWSSLHANTCRSPDYFAVARFSITNVSMFSELTAPPFFFFLPFKHLKSLLIQKDTEFPHTVHPPVAYSVWARARLEAGAGRSSAGPSQE